VSLSSRRTGWSSRRTGWLRQLALIPHLVVMDVRAQMEYRVAFWIDRIAQVITYGSSFAMIWIIADRFGGIAGWNWADLAMLFSFHLIGYAVGASVSFTQMRDLEEQVRLGTLDTILTKPVNAWVYIVFARLNIGYASHAILGVILMAVAIVNLDIDWTLLTTAYFAISLVSAAMVTGSILTFIGATALIWTRSNHLYSLYFGFWELSRYPLNVFPAAIQGVMLTILPLGFMAAVPVAVLLGKPVPFLGDWAAPAALLAGPAFTVVTIAYWRYAMSRYQGAGG
jgi:ABC-2 type transport system permease protein